MLGSTRQGRAVWRTPHPSATCSGTDSTFSGGSRASKKGVPFRSEGRALQVRRRGMRRALPGPWRPVTGRFPAPRLPYSGQSGFRRQKRDRSSMERSRRCDPREGRRVASDPRDYRSDTGRATVLSHEVIDEIIGNFEVLNGECLSGYFWVDKEYARPINPNNCYAILFYINRYISISVESIVTEKGHNPKVVVKNLNHCQFGQSLKIPRRVRLSCCAKCKIFI